MFYFNRVSVGMVRCLVVTMFTVGIVSMCWLIVWLLQFLNIVALI
jgi:hypothetical protein